MSSSILALHLRTHLHLQNISPTMDGTIVAIGVSLIICVVWTLIAPEKNANVYDAYNTIELEDCSDFEDANADDPMAMNRALEVRALSQYKSRSSSICRANLVEVLFPSHRIKGSPCEAASEYQGAAMLLFGVLGPSKSI